MRNIIFLDIDGVLAGEDFLRSTHRYIDPVCVDMLNQLSGCEIVISSSWGTSADAPLKEAGLNLPIVGHTQHLSLNHEYICRGNEIEKWLTDTFGGMGTKFGPSYKNEVYNYVILDDDCDMLYGQSENFIRVSRETGLTWRDIMHAKKILGI